MKICFLKMYSLGIEHFKTPCTKMKNMNAQFRNTLYRDKHMHGQFLDF